LTLVKAKFRWGAIIEWSDAMLVHRLKKQTTGAFMTQWSDRY